jgi:hypothetical protein
MELKQSTERFLKLEYGNEQSSGFAWFLLLNHL